MKTVKVDSVCRVRLSGLEPGDCYQVRRNGDQIVMDRVPENKEPVTVIVNSKQEAEAAIAAVAYWLAGQTKGFKPRPDALSDAEEPELAEPVREWCQELLSSAKAAGHGACKLCQA